MISIKHIPVATDGSPDSLRSAVFAGDLARATEARITVLIVQDEDLFLPNAWGMGEFPEAWSYALLPVDDMRALFEKRARENALPEAAAAIGYLPPSPELLHRCGHVVTEIRDFAAENDVDLTVVGSHGRSGVKRLLIGSVSNAVAAAAHCPVTIVR